MNTPQAPMEIYMIVKDPELIRRLMKNKEPELKARQLSRLMGWKSHSYLNRILSGEVHSVSNDTGVRLSYYLGVTPDVIFVTKGSANAGRSLKAVS